MKKTSKILCAALAICMLLAIASVAATETLKTIQVSENIKVTIDGSEFKPKDGAGNAIKPFVYNGVAYVPMSAFANALGFNATYDSKTQSTNITYNGKNKINKRTMSSAGLIQEFVRAGLPIKKIITYTEETDLNGILGTPHSYVEKIDFFDERHLKENEYCTVEVFDTVEDCTARYNYINLVYESYPLKTMWMYMSDVLLVRFSKTIPEEIVNKYITAIKSYTQKDIITPEKKVTTPSTPSTPTTPTTPIKKTTTGEANALKKAKSYLNLMAFSYEGLIKQLEYEKYTHKEAVYAADNCGADWNEQALKKAKSYLSLMAFSYSGLIKQLEYEKYTTKQATYGADKCGADWNEQAVKKAKSYIDLMSFSRDRLIAQLEYEGFTHEQAVYGAKKNGY